MQQSTLSHHFHKMNGPTRTPQKPDSNSNSNKRKPQDTDSPNRTPQQSPFAQKRRDDLRIIAAETLSVLPTLTSQVSQLHFTHASMHHFYSLAPLDPKNCPRFTLPSGGKGTRIRVLDTDTLDAALTLQLSTTPRTLIPPPPGPSGPSGSTPSNKPVLILNLANATHAGGGWKNGALAQEEALCYRSSLSLSLQDKHYPIPMLSALYTEHCLIIRDAMSRGHDLLLSPTGSVPTAMDLPITSVLTLAALCRPRLTDRGEYARREDVEIMKYKIRLLLRIAAMQGHRRLVLGALGCGAFGNPPDQVALMFREVFEEEEFAGGWWADVVFAVMDNARGDKGGKQGDGNYGVFFRALEGMVV